MTEFEAQLRRIAGLLGRYRRNYALVGGLAVSTRAEPRFTRDADLAVAVTDDSDAESLIRLLQSEGYSVVAAVEQEATGRLASIRLLDRAVGNIVVDLLFASSGVEPEITDAAETIEILPNFSMPVATIGHLIAMKLLARDDRRRPADADDLRALRAVATAHDWSQAAEAIRLIELRGFARGRDLHEGLSSLRTDDAY